MTQLELLNLTNGLGPRDFEGFAARVTMLDPVLGETVKMHAEAADGNSPDLIPHWIDGALDDQISLREQECQTPEQARAWRRRPT